MNASKRMVLLLQGGLSKKAQLNQALVGALNASAGDCDTCLSISREIDANPRTVDVYIRRLRSKLEQTTGCRIETVVNVGYKLVLPQP